MKKRVVVIGSNSFSGSHYIDLLLEKNEYEVIGVSRSKEKKEFFLPYKRHKQGYFKFFQIDLNHDLIKIEKILDEFEPHYIVNFAAQSEVGPSWENPHHWYQTNAVALTKLVHILKDKKYIKKYVHISSPEVYGTCEGRVSEDKHLNPSTPYAASKAAGDFSLFTYYKNYNFPLVMVRATNVYGEGQQLFKIIPRTIIYIKQGKKIALHGGGNAVKSYIHIRDVSNGELLIMENGRIGQIYHLSPSHGISIKDVVKHICNKMKVSFEDNTEIAKERLGQDKAYVIDSSRARKELNWSDEISFSEGIERTIDWVNDNYEEIKKERLAYCHVK